MFYIKVHRAVLHNGEQVAVKVQRPGLKKLYSSSYLGQCQKVLVIYTFGDIYKLLRLGMMGPYYVE